jgi:selenocysteine-specific elongation factor
MAYLRSIERLQRGEGIVPLLENSPYGMSLRELSRLLGLSAARIQLPLEARAVEISGDHCVILESQWQVLYETALMKLRKFHDQQPDEPGIDRGRLRRMIAADLSDALWRVLVEQMLRDGVIERSEHWLHLPQHRITFSEHDLALAERLGTLVAAGDFEPPWVRAMAATVRVSEDEVRRVLRKWVLRRQVYQVVPDLFYHRDSMQRLAQAVRTLHQQQGIVTAVQFRDVIRIGRKRVIQILEFFDRVGYTRRLPHGRVVRADSSWFESDAK